MQSKTNSSNCQRGNSKLKTTLTAFLWTSLLTANATATETILKAGKVAPFNGVLVSEKTYRAYVTNEFEIKSLRDDVSILTNQVEGLQKLRQEDKFNEPDVWNWFLGGVILGALAGFSAAK